MVGTRTPPTSNDEKKRLTSTADGTVVNLVDEFNL